MEIPEDQFYMRRAIELAAQGQGFVEPNPMVGCVLVRDGEIIGEGFHEKFGQAHAEINALAACGDASAATAFVTLEPCCHRGKTGPCTNALIDAGVAKVVIAMPDPFEKVSGQGIEQLKQAGIDVQVGVCESEAVELNRPYIKRLQTGKPWVICKWAMTLDGKIATHTGSSQWITNEQSRAVVHELRGRMDAIVVGIGTSIADDPMLTARPPGARVPMRVVVDSDARIAIDSKLVTSADKFPTLIAVGPAVDHDKCQQLRDKNCTVIQLNSADYSKAFAELLDYLGQLQMTNVLVEGGGKVFGTLHDAKMIDEVHCFIAPKIVGGTTATSPVAGSGLDLMEQAIHLSAIKTKTLDDNVYVSGRTNYSDLS